MGSKRVSTAFLLLLSLPLSAQQVVYVDLDATGANDGTSWTDAYRNLRPALDGAAPGSDLWVAEGTYLPGRTAEPADTFRLRDGVRLFGGFSGVETSLSQRDWALHPTVLSGDVGQDDDYTGWPSSWTIGTANSAHVVTAHGVGAGAVLDGFVVMAGHTGPSGTPAGHPNMVGGGIYCVGGSPTVANCTFRYHVSGFSAGGAIHCWDGSPAITACRFERNWAHIGNGGALFTGGASAPVLEDCVFSENVATGGTGGGQGLGGAIANQSTLEFSVERCTFDLNEARGFYPAGGNTLCTGGAIGHAGASLTVRESVFTRNRSHGGGAIHAYASATIVNCEFTDNLAYKYDLGGISSGGYGGAIATFLGPSSSALVASCTVAGNTSGEGAVHSLWSPTLLANSIVWGNAATGGGVPPVGAQIKGSVEVEFSCVEALLALIPGEDPPDPGNFPGSFDFDPLFADLAGRDLHLANGSPCADTGDDSLLPGGFPLDLGGRPRIQGGRIAMGAFEPTPEAATAVYCRSKENSHGCLPRIASTGTPSASQTSGFELRGFNVLGGKSGLLFYGTTGPAGIPFLGGTLCVTAPIRRTPIRNSGGDPLSNPCTGVYALDMNAYAHGLLGGNPSPLLLVPGTTVWCQWWGRDPGFSPDNVTLTDGLRFTIEP